MQFLCNMTLDFSVLFPLRQAGKWTSIYICCNIYKQIKFYIVLSFVVVKEKKEYDL